MSLKNLGTVIEWIRNNLDPEINIQKIDLLIKVSQNEGIGQQDLGKLSNLASGSVSRHLMKLGTYYDRKAEREMGLGLIIQTPNPMNRRQMSVYMSTKGKQTMQILEGILDA